MNAGAYGGDIAGVLERALVVTADGSGWLTPAELGLSYRHSGLHHGQVVARAELRLAPQAGRRDQGHGLGHAGAAQGGPADEQAHVRQRLQEPGPRALRGPDARGLRPARLRDRRRADLAAPRELHRERGRRDVRRCDRADGRGAPARAASSSASRSSTRSSSSARSSCRRWRRPHRQGRGRGRRTSVRGDSSRAPSPPPCGRSRTRRRGAAPRRRVAVRAVDALGHRRRRAAPQRDGRVRGRAPVVALRDPLDRGGRREAGARAAGARRAPAARGDEPRRARRRRGAEAPRRPPADPPRELRPCVPEHAPRGRRARCSRRPCCAAGPTAGSISEYGAVLKKLTPPVPEEPARASGSRRRMRRPRARTRCPRASRSRCAGSRRRGARGAPSCPQIAQGARGRRRA